MGTKHRSFLGADLHRFGVLSDTDPATTYGTDAEGTGVAPGLCWIKHSPGLPNSILDVYIRNAANSAWVSLTTVFGTFAPSPITVTTQTGTTYTLLLADAETYIVLTNASAITFTVPQNSSVAFPIGTSIVIQQGGAGQVTIAPGTGTTLQSEGGKLKLVAQYAVASLTKVALNTWTVYGNLTT